MWDLGLHPRFVSADRVCAHNTGLVLFPVRIDSDVLNCVGCNFHAEICSAMPFLDEHILAVVAFDMEGVSREFLFERFNNQFRDSVL